MRSVFIFALVSILYVVGVFGQRGGCPGGNLIRDSGFEANFDAGGYCRSGSVAITVDEITLCTVNYDGTNITGVLSELSSTGNPTQVFLNATLHAGDWVPFGTVDVITSQYQTVANGLWGLKLNGQFGPGGVTQTVTVTQNDPNCFVSWWHNTNVRSPVGFSSQYNAKLQKVGKATPEWTVNVSAPATQEQGTLVQRYWSPNTTLSGAGDYVLTFTSLDTANTVFPDAAQHTLNYFGRTGAIIDDVCFSCLATPSPSITPTQTPTASPSLTPSTSPSRTASATPSRTASASASVSASPSPSASASPSPVCPAPIIDDDDYEHWVEADSHRPEEEDSEDTTTVNFYFADIFGGNDHKKW